MTRVSRIAANGSNDIYESKGGHRFILVIDEDLWPPPMLADSAYVDAAV
jgi:hypothetical protein